MVNTFLEGLKLRKLWFLLGCILMLFGCGVQDTFETVADDLAVSSPLPAQVVVFIPEDAATPVMEAEDGSKLYLCDAYSVSVQTLHNTDINTTLKELTGFLPEKLTVIHTNTHEMDQYSCVWSAAGEGVPQVCRALILDDGAYHYAVTVMADQDRAGALEETWKTIRSSVELQY